MIKLIGVMVAGIPAVVGSILAFMARKWGTAVASIALVVSLTVAMIVCINSILQTVLAALAFPGWLLTAVGMFIPANFAAVLGAIIAAKTCRAAFDLALLKTKLFNNAS